MRLLLNWVLSAIAVWIVAQVVPGVHVSGPAAALIAALAIGFINATIGLVLNRESINDLPLVSRNPFDLAFLAPGVSQAPGTAYGQGVGTPGFITNFVSDGSRNASS